MSALVPVIRASMLLLWLLSAPILAASALFALKRSRGPARLWLSGTILVANWTLFIVFLIRSETPYGVYYRTFWGTDILLLLSFLGLIPTIAASPVRWRLFLGNAALMTLWISIAYAPAHWLSRVDFGSVTVDGHRVPAAVYFGHPTDSGAEAIVLVRLRDGGDYFLDFGSEKVRKASRSEYVRVPEGVWCIRSMQEGTFYEPLQPEQMNQFRIASDDKHIIVVQF